MEGYPHRNRVSWQISLKDGEPSMPSRNGECCRVDRLVVLHINEWTRVEFTYSARSHKIGTARVRQVPANQGVVDRVVEEHDPGSAC